MEYRINLYREVPSWMVREMINYKFPIGKVMIGILVVAYIVSCIHFSLVK